MSANKRVLVIESDAGLAELLHRHFTSGEYECQVATTCAEGLELADTLVPHLILLAARLPDMAGADALRLLRDRPRTAHIPIMILAASGDDAQRNALLAGGAYDIIDTPPDLDILSLRVRNALRRAEREGLVEPRTGLPTGRLIDERLAALDGERGWYRIDVTLAEFAAFRDLYGFVTANEALRFAGNLISQIVNEHGGPDDFVGHPTGSEQFVIVTTQARGPQIRRALAARLDGELQSFYGFVERDQGFVAVENGAGKWLQMPLMSAAIAVSWAADADPPPDEGNDWEDAAEPPGSPFEW